MKPALRTGLASVAWLSLAAPASAQQARETRMLITVVDQTNAVIPEATVTVTGSEPATQKTVARAGEDHTERPGDHRRPDAGTLYGARGVSRLLPRCA